MADACTDCPVCLEPFTKAIRKEISCQFCKKSVCKSCFQQYIVSLDSEANCLHCKAVIPFDTIAKVCTGTFMNQQFKEHRKKLLFEEEKNHLPEAQQLIQLKKHADELREKATKFYKYQQKLRQELAKVSRTCDRYATRVNRCMHAFDRGDVGYLDRLTAGDGAAGGAGESKEGEEDTGTSRGWICPCPHDDCRGYIESRTYQCGTCDRKICKRCRVGLPSEREMEEELDEDGNPLTHTCKQSDLDTVALIRRSCKPCPKCSTQIHKIAGCDQMWCTQCHTTFSWRTGRVVDGIVHNPHYFEYVRNNGNVPPRAPGDMVCGGLPHAYRIRQRLQGAEDHYGQDGVEYVAQISSFVRFCTHIQHVELDPLRRMFNENNDRDIRMFRVRYLEGDATEDEYKGFLVHREKIRRRNREKLQIWEMFVTVATEHIQTMLNKDEEDRIHETTQNELLSTLHALIDYTNESMQKASKVHRLKFPQIDYHQTSQPSGRYHNRHRYATK